MLTWACTHQFPWALGCIASSTQAGLCGALSGISAHLYPVTCIYTIRLGCTEGISDLQQQKSKPGAGFPVTVMQSAAIDPLLGNRLCTCEVTVIVLFLIYCPCLAWRDLEIYVCYV